MLTWTFIELLFEMSFYDSSLRYARKISVRDQSFFTILDIITDLQFIEIIIGKPWSCRS